MAAHVATQEANPARTMWRTILQVGIPAFSSLVLILPFIIQEVLATFGETMPPELRAWLAGTAAFITALAGLLARLMTNPAVNDWLRRYAPKLAPDPQPVDNQQ